MRKVADYRTHAEKCRELAQSMSSLADKETLENLARSWERLADLRKRDLEGEAEGRRGN